IADDLGAIERGTQDGGVGDLAAQSAADALSITVATGSLRSGSGLGLTVSDGQPESLMQEWSPVQISSSTPKRTRTTRSPRLSFSASSGRTRRWRASWHSPSAMITLRPRSAVRMACFKVFVILATL